MLEMKLMMEDSKKAVREVLEEECDEKGQQKDNITKIQRKVIDTVADSYL